MNNEHIHRPYARVEAVVIGVSAGGLDALSVLLEGFPTDYGLPLIVVQHIPEGVASQLAVIFDRKLALRVKEANDKMPIESGCLYFAPPGYHLLVETNRHFSLSIDPRVHFSRPAIDALFESAADTWGPALAGVLLTGANADGAAGLRHIAEQGGLALVQDPAEAQVDTMPRSALALFTPHHVLPLAGLRELLLQLDC
ncbi:chemotaxis protein CheB [Pseudomonas matsuisoli]|uniref:protein-glutamate methylesterase n=1 Tax=Pseudomonas matsuisoli TaxID=1515666 RepID=A0A917PLI4_9PSED|nr:chemotaxis protein CheB [Pseudomonas matsuisoli]GGJ83395.1 chemotaxis protein CheB [Pseudomonas matsuisoli]